MELAERVEPVFKDFALGPYRIACGFPSRDGIGRKMVRLGECHAKEFSRGKLFEIFISPLLDNSLEVAGTVVHEMAHIAAGIQDGHGREYAKVCKHVGLTRGKVTNAMPGVRLNDHLRKIIDVQGKYPHHKIVPKQQFVIRAKTTMRLECDKCGCKVTMTTKWLDNAGAPTCACGGRFE